MKKRLMTLRREVAGLKLPVEDKHKLIMLNHNIYYCFSIAVEENFDMGDYRVYLTRAVLYYLSAPFTNYENRIGFVKSFYESYIMFDHEAILSSVSDTSSILYDSSVESFLARALAIADVYKENTCRELFNDLESSLQNEKNMV